MKLSRTSKMPCASYALPAVIACHRGQYLKNIEGSICANCYAYKGNYWFKGARNLRVENLTEAKLCETSNYDFWIVQAKVLIIQSGYSHFRWFDSGDCISQKMANAISEVALSLPDIRFWVSTRENYVYADCDNLCVRISDDYIDTNRRLFGVRSLVSKKVELDGYQCPAKSQDNKCYTCRECWNKNQEVIVYKYH
jgi:hypothetical protein